MRLLPANQYAVCDACPPLTPLTALKVELPQAPAAFKFSVPVAAVRDTEKVPQASGVEPIATVFFARNSYRMKGGERNRIRAAQASLQSGKRLSVVGYTCDSGTQRENDLLAVRRAETVGGFLHALGISQERLEVTGKGRCCYASEVPAENRRVEITAKDGP